MLLVVSFGFVGCKKDPSRAPLKLYQGVSFPAPTVTLLNKLKLSPKAWKKSLIQHIEKSGGVSWFTEKEPKNQPKDGYQLLVEMGMQPLPPDRRRKRVRVRWFMRYRLLPVTSGNEIHTLQESRDFSYSLKDKLPKRTVVAKLYETLWTQSMYSLTTFARLKEKTSEDLTKALASKDIYEQRHAVLLLGQRKYKPAAKAMLPLLKSKSRPVLLATIGSLVRLRAKEAAVPLIQLSRQREGAFLAQILSALGEIGGEEAKGYLFTIASSHNNKLLRQTAKEALEELRQREARAKEAKRRAPPTRR